MSGREFVSRQFGSGYVRAVFLSERFWAVFMTRREFVSGQLGSRCVRVVFFSGRVWAIFMSGWEFVSEHVQAVFVSEPCL